MNLERSGQLAVFTPGQGSEDTASKSNAIGMAKPVSRNKICN
jgi:hypothetical protein